MQKEVSSLYRVYIGVCKPSGWFGRDGTIAKIRTIYPDMSRFVIPKKYLTHYGQNNAEINILEKEKKEYLRVSVLYLHKD